MLDCAECLLCIACITLRCIHFDIVLYIVDCAVLYCIFLMELYRLVSSCMYCSSRRGQEEEVAEVDKEKEVDDTQGYEEDNAGPNEGGDE